MLGDLEIVDEAKRITKCKKCGEVFNDTEEMFKIFRDYINLLKAFEKLRGVVE
jgi:acetone carboxylase gamma subunit